jgi:hypothetical protein
MRTEASAAAGDALKKFAIFFVKFFVKFSRRDLLRARNARRAG